MYYVDSFIIGGVKSVRDSTLAYKQNRYSLLANIKHIRIHDFRHSHTSFLINNSINIQEVARRLGHSKVEITWNTYSHLYPNENEKAVDLLNRVKIV